MGRRFEPGFPSGDLPRTPPKVCLATLLNFLGPFFLVTLVLWGHPPSRSRSGGGRVCFRCFGCVFYCKFVASF